MKQTLSARRAVLLAAVAIGVTACGPTLGVDVGLKQAGAPIFFGVPTQPPAPSSPPLNVNPLSNFPAPLETPPELSLAPVAVPIPACPSAQPNSALVAVAVPVPTAPPANTAAPYPFRFSGATTVDPGAKDQTVTKLPTSGTRAVSNSGPGSFEVVPGVPTSAIKVMVFSVTETFNGMQTQIDYMVVPQGASPPTVATQTNETPAAGLYLESMTTTTSTGAKETFTPGRPGVELMPFPTDNNIGTNFQSAGVDSVNDEAMVLPQSPGSAITGKQVVDACGLLLEAWEVKINGYLTKPLAAAGQPTDCPGATTCSPCPAGAAGNTGYPNCTPFTLVLDVGTEFGGLPLQDHLTMDKYDTALNKPFQYDVTATIGREPGT